MRQTLAIRLLSSAALAAFISVTAINVLHAEDASKKAVDASDTVTFEPDRVDTFSGAFLAARTADVDHDYINAIALYKKALMIEPGNPEIRQRLMISLLLNGNIDEGVKYANELKSDPTVERITTIVRGMDAMRRHDYSAAQAILKYTGPNDLDRMMNGLLAAWAQVGAGRGKEALAMVDKMQGPNWFDIFKNYQAGTIALVIGDTKSARTHLNSAVLDKDGGATAPDTYMRAVMALASLEAKEGNKQKALDAISVGDSMISNFAPLNALRDSIGKGEKPEQAVTNASQGAASVLFSVAAALNRDGAEDVVSLYLETANALDPKSSDTLVLLGGIAEKQDQMDRAIAFYKQVPPGSPMARISELQLGLALAQGGKSEDALKHLKSLIESDPKDIRSYLAYGNVLSQAKNYQAMADNYDKAVEVIGPVPTKADWNIFYQRAIAYERLKKWDIAEPNFKKALELNPDQPQVLNYLGYSWVDMNRNLDEGLAMIKKAVDARPDDGYIVDSLGWAYFRLNRFDDAVKELERAVQLEAGDVTVNDHLGDAYWRVGRRLEAVYQWNRAITYKPEEADLPRLKDKIANGLPPLDDPKAAEKSKPPAAVPAETPPVDKKS
ncbi:MULTISPECIES: tetratricopeptide repeat protein [Rhizobium]|uniref:Tetratricopeptide repeat protein n=1 Tax=Rhizobium rhododendri TaxID=2506430 RepID=A0ABY8II54_9HYPH|nr:MULTISPECIES: tetratricopeptide repeat protein [Rhizobium]MBZ5760998.1 tetratricopeptide repeat protein [Rhizobium sp. VS19-DR96]MBZ5767314.1 tetratricopeptide repeat protein [Rhizobium sp. VS19-DR129.2]MBZ5773397.1 tetratricopeptide repeat protein [Rhizobium sp. VS19-DRK62.2]MBZ5785626.1 tetratricopeptide repeat protein [Rhizobium sp. VS19-DR121]MBZ5805265.1 tetratricopeptide repeat protein [Rhizobium sp. VS19-DR181]